MEGAAGPVPEGSQEEETSGEMVLGVKGECCPVLSAGALKSDPLVYLLPCALGLTLLMLGASLSSSVSWGQQEYLLR